MFDKFLGLFGLARRRDLVRAVETQGAYFGQLKKAVAERDIARVEISNQKLLRKGEEAKFLRQIALVIDQYGKVSA